MDPCSGSTTAVAPDRPARLCTGCEWFDYWAEQQHPGFRGSTCDSFSARHVAAPPQQPASPGEAGRAPGQSPTA